ncbi:MAG TPA: hypothetical protein VHM91_25610, partial [Verrucomicrobiales bacterium]|nr:hypothetical protein [Verrucomicrobiales bacterium]
MKSSVLLRAAAFLFLVQSPLFAQAGPKEDDFLIFDKIEEDTIAKPSFIPARAPDAPPAAASKRPLPSNTKASLRTILLDVPEKSFATGRLSALTATASQDGDQALPVFQFAEATTTLQASLEKAATALVAANAKFP